MARTIGSHSASGLSRQRIAILGSQRRANRLEIVARIKALGDRADIFAQRLAVAQVGRAREHIDLRAGIIDVIFARDRKAGEGEQIRQRVAEHGAAAMADMHRPGRICRDIFDIDQRTAADVALAVVRTELDGAAQRLDPGRGLEREIDEARPGDLDLGDQIVGAKLFRNRFRELARLFAGILGEHHGGIGRHVAMRRIARRLDRHARLIDAGRQHAGGNQFIVRAPNASRAFRRRCYATTMRNSTLRRHVGAPRA